MQRFRVGIIGISGYGGGEALRYLASHPNFDLVYAAGESSAGSTLASRFPGVASRYAPLVIQKFDVATLPELDLLIASLPTNESRSPLAKVPTSTRIVDIGGDHRYVEGWTYGLADVWPDRVRSATRIANPGCYPAATLNAIAPLARAGLIEIGAPVIVDAKSGVSGAGRGGGDSKFGFAEVNEDVMAYGLLKHTHMPEISATMRELSGSDAPLVFTPHLIPMTRGILSTIYMRGSCTTQQALDAARTFYADRPFVRIVEAPPHTKWTSGSNLNFITYACDPARNLVMAVSAIDNLGKGAAGQAIQNANLMLGLPETTGLEVMPIWP
jgi:N-acetyl-gamma-glutamyl-phosphate reductase